MSDRGQDSTKKAEAGLARCHECGQDVFKPQVEETKGGSQDDEGPTPPYSVYNWWQKRLIAFTAAIAGLFSPLSTNIYYPALSTIADDLHVSISQVNLTVSTYMVFLPAIVLSKDLLRKTPDISSFGPGGHWQYGR